jgi:arylsulfatase A-like enzyme
VAFIQRNQSRPFLLYLAYLTPHWPLEANPKDLARHRDAPSRRRATFLAMMDELDRGVGRILQPLQDAGLEKDTLIIFTSDNGGARFPPGGTEEDDVPGLNTSRNDPFRGVKGELLEGGIRVPFLIQWPGKLPAGATYDRPVSTLDVVATAMAAANAAPPAEPNFDGVNLIPFLDGTNKGEPHDALFWRFWGQTAVRSGRWKLLELKHQDKPALFDLDADLREQTNVADQHPEHVARLRRELKAWLAQLREPLWPAPDG